jgi:hypothetical protein
MKKKLLILANPYKGTSHHLPGVEKDPSTIKSIFTGDEVIEIVTPFTASDVLGLIQMALKGLKKGDVLFIYYSGHGTQFQLNGATHEALFCEYDGKGYLLKDTDLKAWTKTITETTVVFILDCCFSKGMMRNVAPPNYKEKYYIPKDGADLLTFSNNANLPILGKCFFAVACSEKQVSWDTEKGGALTLELEKAKDEGVTEFKPAFAKAKTNLIGMQTPSTNVPKYVPFF